MRRPSRNDRAFTLAEMIIVVLVVSIAAAMVIPYAVGASGSQALAAARMIASDLQYAQNAAITTQTKVTVTFNNAARSYTLTNASGSLIHPMTKTAYTVDFAAMQGFAGLSSMTASFPTSQAVTFDETVVPDNAGSVTVNAGCVAYRVDLAAATGNVTVTPL